MSEERKKTTVRISNCGGIRTTKHGTATVLPAEWSPTVSVHFDQAERTEVAVRKGAMSNKDGHGEYFYLEVSSGPYAETDAEVDLFVSRVQLEQLIELGQAALNGERNE